MSRNGAGTLLVNLSIFSGNISMLWVDAIIHQTTIVLCQAMTAKSLAILILDLVFALSVFWAGMN